MVVSQEFVNGRYTIQFEIICQKDNRVGIMISELIHLRKNGHLDLKSRKKVTGTCAEL